MAKVVKNKFIKEITASSADIKGKRAAIVASQVTAAQQLLINDLSRKCDQLELRVEELTDLAPKSTTSLRIGDKNFSAQAWVQELHQTKVQLEEAKVDLGIAEETFEEWFKELPAEEETPAETTEA